MRSRGLPFKSETVNGRPLSQQNAEETPKVKLKLNNKKKSIEATFLFRAAFSRTIAGTKTTHYSHDFQNMDIARKKSYAM